MFKKQLLVLAIIGLLLPHPESWAYEEINVKNGGSLQGHITLKGDVPRPKGYNLVTFPDPYFCGRISDGDGWRLLQPFQVSDSGGFQNVVIFFKKVKQGKAFNYTPQKSDSVDCKFEPYITIVRNKHTVDVVNMDPVMHDIQAYETSHLGARVLFNVPLPMSKNLRKSQFMDGKNVKKRAGKVMTQRVNMRKGRNVFVMQCGFHAYMESWGIAVENPYFAKSDQNGHFQISDIPPGTYDAVAWHPMLRKEFTVTIKPGETTTFNIDFDAPTGRLYANEALKNTRFGTELLGKSQIVPMVERQTY